MMNIEALRHEYLSEICQHIFYLNSEDIPNIANENNQLSVALAKGIVKQLRYPLRQTLSSGQTAGMTFEEITKKFLKKAFHQLEHVRPVGWRFSVNADITQFDGYEHLTGLAEILNQCKDLNPVLSDYLIKPDIIVGRALISEVEINQQEIISDRAKGACLTPLQESNALFSKPTLHAVISCNWTLRSDRSQNARTEGLNLIRNRKGHTPHIAVVTAEPYPQRLASLALGTGDVDCVYHVALPELEEAAKEYDNPAVTDMLETLVEGKRLRDISDLPFDLAA